MLLRVLKHHSVEDMARIENLSLGFGDWDQVPQMQEGHSYIRIYRLSLAKYMMRMAVISTDQK